MATHLDRTTLTDSFSILPDLIHGTVPTGSSLFSQDHLTHEDRTVIEQLAAELLEDPIALQHFCDHIYDLLKKDIVSQYNR
jgi:hypothetical protein